MADYDITGAFKRIEDDLIASMIRNLDRHRAEEDELGIRWPQWQVEQLRALERYKEANKKRFTTFQDINSQIDAMIRQAYTDGSQDQEVGILNAIKRGFRGVKRDPILQASFFRLNERKLESLIKATVSDMQAAETAVLRLSEDKYRSIIFNAQVFANTGAGSYTKAVDMATRDFLKAGLNCVQYKNGARHTLSDYADMAIKTASTRAYLQGEGQRRQEWGISTVIMNKRGNPCPKCLPFVGKVLIDDVWSGGSSEDGDYPLMSDAIAAGLYHPRCKDGHVTYFPEFDDEPDDSFTIEEIAEIEERNREEAKLQYAFRQVEMFGMLAQYSLDPENKKAYAAKEKEWTAEYTSRLSKSTVIDETVSSADCLSDDSFVDITQEWRKSATPNSNEVLEMNEFLSGGKKYIVDGKHVVLDYSENEKMVAEILRKEFGGEIFIVPKVLSPNGVKTPDYIFRGERYDLKELSGTSKNLIYNRLHKQKKQSHNFILDFTNCALNQEEIIEQIRYIYRSKNTEFVNCIIIIKNAKVLKVFTRKK